MPMLENVSAINLRCNNDSSGNPRGVYVFIDGNNDIVHVEDEGYAGWKKERFNKALNEKGYTLRIKSCSPVRLDTSIKEYNRLVKMSEQ